LKIEDFDHECKLTQRRQAAKAQKRILKAAQFRVRYPKTIGVFASWREMAFQPEIRNQ
jgi:hypothetical protein